MRHAAAHADRLVQITLLGEAINGCPVAVFVFDEEGRYVAFNEQATQLTGYPRDELVSMRLGQLAEDAQAATETYRAVAEGRAPGAATRIRRKDGSLVEVQFRGGETTIGGMPFYVGVAWEAA